MDSFSKGRPGSELGSFGEGGVLGKRRHPLIGLGSRVCDMLTAEQIMAEGW